MSMFDHDDLYANYFDYGTFRHLNLSLNDDTTEKSSNDTTWLGVTRFILTILLRIGFLLVQIGSVPVTNINLILLQNIVDFSSITIVYVLAGFVIAYNGDINGLIGEGRWIGDETIDKDQALVGWQAVNVASAICASSLVGRTHTIGYLLVATIMAGLVQPLVIHWIWTTKGWMARNNIYDRTVGFRDYAGSTVVHTVGSLTGYIGCSILGRRIIRLRDIDEASIPADSAGMVFAGYSLVLLGLQSLCLPNANAENPEIWEKEMSHIVVNNLLAATACSVTVVALHFILSHEPFNHWTVMRCVQASVAGTTIVSAGVNFYTPIFCLGLGFSGGIIHYLVSRRVFQSALEDYCNIVATHLVCSLVGSIVAPFGATIKNNDDHRAMLFNVAWQVICLVAVVALVSLTMTLAFSFLECIGILRNRSEIVNHLRAIVAAERGPPRSYMQRIFLPEGETSYLQPRTARVQERAIESAPRTMKGNTTSPRIQKIKSPEVVQETRKSVDSEVIVSSSRSRVDVAKRVKKLRHVHTLRSTSDITTLEAEGNSEAMGDSRISTYVKKKTENEGQICENGQISMMECAGDSSAERVKIFDGSLIDKLDILDNGTNVRNESNKSLKRCHEPGKLHRTQKCTNLRLEAINENDDDGVKYLVLPRARSFTSTESDSDGELVEIVRKKCLLNFSTSVPVSLVRKTPECTDIRL